MLQSDLGEKPSAIQPPVDRTRALRTSLLVRAECKSSRISVVCHCENVSESGLLVLSKETFAEGTEVTLRFALPPKPIGPAVEVDGSVVRTDEGNFMAIKFAHLRPIHHAAIANYVERDIAMKTL
jgi:hypothetical protein